MGSGLHATEDTEEPRRDRRDLGEGPALVVAWWRSAPERVGEMLWRGSRDRTCTFGRGPWTVADSPPERAVLVRQRPGRTDATEPVTAPRISRDQLAVGPGPQRSLVVTALGRRGLRVNGRPGPRAEVRAGDVVVLDREMVWVCVDRPVQLPPHEGPLQVFGAADDLGWVGESPTAWVLRSQVAFLAPRGEHVLVHGDSGVGKELVARALHAASRRQRGPWVSRNAATLPEGLVDAELFGNLRNYPNPGTPDRPGLVGAADGGTLFLDEFGELDRGSQAHLLRVLDDGEYSRLGESRSRRADLRLVAATNRDLDELKHDVLARIVLRIEVPGLCGRVDDIPLLATHLLRQIAADDPQIASRFMAGEHPRVSAELMVQLLRHAYTTHVRELKALLWRSMSQSVGDRLEALPDLPDRSVELGGGAWAGVVATDLPAHVVQAALDRANGVQERAWRLLGLNSRYQLQRLIKRHGLVIRRR